MFVVERTLLLNSANTKQMACTSDADLDDARFEAALQRVRLREAARRQQLVEENDANCSRCWRITGFSLLLTTIVLVMIAVSASKLCQVYELHWTCFIADALTAPIVICSLILVFMAVTEMCTQMKIQF